MAQWGPSSKKGLSMSESLRVGLQLPGATASSCLFLNHKPAASVEPASTATTFKRPSMCPVDRHRNMAVIDHLLSFAADQHGREATTPMGSHHNHVGVA
jgi:hypothetical protein